MVGVGQVFNRMSADETRSGTGFKAGNLGMSGRSYVTGSKRTAQSEGGGRNPCYGSKICGGVSALLIAICLAFSERSAYNDVSVIEELRDMAVSTSDQPDDSNNRVGIVHITSHDVTASAPLRDSDFGVTWRNALSAKRETEYCQWEQVRHTRSKVVGKDPDTCVNMGGDECENNSCPRSPPCGNCCRRREGDDIVEHVTSFSYHKGWRQNRISSLLFDDVMTYQNPTRDPFPSQTYTASSVSIGGYTALGSDLTAGAHTHGASASVQTRLGEAVANNIGASALAQGFSEIGIRYIYSRVPKDGWGQSLVQKAARYLIDGVVDLGDMGTCKAGDIRVSFHSEPLAPVLSVVAQRAGSKLVPYISAAQSHTPTLLVYNGVLSAPQMCARAQSEALASARWQRAVCIVVAFVVWFLFKWAGGNSACDCTANCVLPVLYALLTVGAATTLLHVWFWGFADSAMTAALLVVLPAAAVAVVARRPKTTKNL